MKLSLKLSREDRDSRSTVLRLEGRLTERELGELGATCQGCLDEGRQLVLDLAGVRFVDGPGARALVALRRRRVGLRGASGFVEALLQATD